MFPALVGESDTSRSPFDAGCGVPGAVDPEAQTLSFFPYQFDVIPGQAHQLDLRLWLRMLSRGPRRKAHRSVAKRALHATVRRLAGPR